MHAMLSLHRTIETDLDEIARRASADLDFFDGKRVLITGGAGFLLSYFVDVLVRRARERRDAGARGPTVVVADIFTTGSHDRLAHLEGDASLTVLPLDITDPASVASLTPGFDVVIHGASIASPIVYRAHPLETIEANALGTLYLLRAVAATPVERFVLMSSSEVYGDPDPQFVPTPETYEGRVSCTGPRACYDESKRLAETIAMTYFRTHRTPIRIVRPFNVYGPGMRLDDGRVVPSLVQDGLAGRDLVLHSDGSPRRSFCYITDFITDLLRVIVGGADGEAYNVGDDRGEIAMSELAASIADATGTRGRVRVKASEEADYLVDNPQRRRPDLTKLRAIGGGAASVDLADGLARYVAWSRTTLEPKSSATQGGAS